MSSLATNAITDAAGGNTTTINGYTPNESNMAGRNRLINSDMRIDQRNAGAAVTIPANAYTYSIDRWFGVCNQASKFSLQQNAGAVTPPAGHSNYLGATSLSAYSVISTDYFTLGQAIEGFNFADVSWGTADAKTVTLSFQVYSSLTGTFGGVIQNSAQNRSYPFSYTISSANTWTQIAVTIAGDTTGTWVGATNGIGARVFWSLGAGSVQSATAGAWVAGAPYSVTGATSVVGTSGATFYITGVQLEAGSVATPFEHRQYGQELALCQRYCQVYGSGNGYERLGMAMGVTSISVNVNIHLPVTMRATPSVSSTGSWGWYNGSAVVAGTTFALDALSTQVVALILATTGATSGSTYQVINLNDPSARLTLNSEL